MPPSNRVGGCGERQAYLLDYLTGMVHVYSSLAEHGYSIHTLSCDVCVSPSLHSLYVWLHTHIHILYLWTDPCMQWHSFLIQNYYT